MSETAFTPGPWFLESTRDTLWVGQEKAVGGKVGDVIVSFEHGPDCTEAHNRRALADANLVTAAPELYAMLDAFIHTPCQQPSRFAELQEQAKQILARARGERQA